MNKLLKFALLITLTFTVASQTGCKAFDQAADWAEENPAKVDLARSILTTGLILVANNNPDLEQEQKAVESIIDYALSEADSPDAAVALLKAKLSEELPRATADQLYAVWEKELQAAVLDDSPASGPELVYARGLYFALNQ